MVLMRRQVLEYLIREFGQIEEVMLGLALDEFLVGIVAAVRIDELDGIHKVAAVFALIAAGIGILAKVACAFHIAIGQEALFALAVEQGLPLLVQITALQQRAENILGHAMVILGIGMREQIVAHADLPLCFQERS